MYFLMMVNLILHGFASSAINSEILHTAGGKDFCIVEGRPYRSGEIIPREHECHICICHMGKAECSWINCPLPPDGCTEFSVTNHCNPQLYVCTIPEHLRGVRTRRNIDYSHRKLDMLLTGSAVLETVSGYRTAMQNRRRREADVAPSSSDEFMRQSQVHELKEYPGDCHVLGVPYKTGDLMGIASSFCLECRCARQNMFCSPKCCFKHIGFYLTPSQQEAAQKSPKLSLDHPLEHLLRW